MGNINSYKDLPDIDGESASDEELEASKNSFKPIPKGEYRARIESFEVKTSVKTQLPYVTFKMRVFDNSKGRIVFNSYFPYNSEVCKNMFHGFLKDLGFTKKMRESFKLSESLPALCTLGVIVKVDVRDYKDKNGNDKQGNEIKGTKPLDTEDKLRMSAEEIQARIKDFGAINEKAKPTSTASGKGEKDPFN